MLCNIVEFILFKNILNDKIYSCNLNSIIFYTCRYDENAITIYFAQTSQFSNVRKSALECW